MYELHRYHRTDQVSTPTSVALSRHEHVGTYTSHESACRVIADNEPSYMLVDFFHVGGKVVSVFSTTVGITYIVKEV